MKIPFSLNDKEIVIDAEPDKKLLYILRDNNLFSVKCGCEEGYCSSCTVLLDNKPVPTCIVPIASIRGRKIVTLEYFQKTKDYEDIDNGFKKAGIHLCGFCNTGKIFTAYQIISKTARPTKEHILKEISQLECKCTNRDILVNGILLAASLRRERFSGLPHGKK